MSQDLVYDTTPEGIQQAREELDRLMEERRELNKERRNPFMTSPSGRKLSALEATNKKLELANRINELSGRIGPLKQFLDNLEANNAPVIERKKFICNMAANLVIEDAELSNSSAISMAIDFAEEAEHQGVAFWLS